jgi:hypothetical protein
MTTYRAFYQKDHSKIIFKGVPKDQVRSRLPEGTKVAVSPKSTIGRTDGGDEYEFAYFEVRGKLILVVPD